jgi:hypothetical protein
MGWNMDVILHIGAHRTGTSSLQAWLMQNEEVLADTGTAVWGPERTRAGLFAGLIKRPDLVNGEDERAARRAATRIRMEIDRLEEAGVQRLIVSEENVMGTMPVCLDHATLYPDLRGRLDRVAEAFGPHLTGVALSVRRSDQWWASVLAVAQARGADAPGARLLDRLAQHPRSWRRVVQVVRSAFGLPVTVWSFEGLLGAHAAQLRAMAPGAGLPSGLYEQHCVRNAAPRVAAWGQGAPATGGNTRYMPFSTRQRGEMTLRYLEDLAWLRSAPPGVVYVEMDAETPGAHPGMAAEEEGLFHDEQKRGLG